MRACHAGSPDEGAEVVRPLKQFGRPIVDLLEPKPYTALQSMFDPLVPHGWHRYYLNFLGDEGADRVRQAYGARQYDRLVELKRAYDPSNFFRHNQNIEP